MTSFLIRHSRILLPDGEFVIGDIVIKQGQILQIAPEITESEVTAIIDATGLTLLPGDKDGKI